MNKLVSSEKPPGLWFLQQILIQTCSLSHEPMQLNWINEDNTPESTELIDMNG